MNSRFKIFGGVGLVIGLLVFIAIVFPIIFSKPYHKEQNDGLPLGFFIFWIAIAIVYLFYHILTRINTIVFESNKLVYRNLIWRKKKEIDLDKIDGYEQKSEIAVAGSHELITLKHEGISLLKISSFYYSNFEEIKEMIKSKLDQIEN